MTNKNDFTLSPVDQNDIEYLICHVGLLWRRLIDNQVKTLGFTGTEKRVLICIGQYPGLTQIQIAKILHLEPQNLTHILDRLMKQNMIDKKTKENDRRVRCLYATLKGKKIIECFRKLSNELKPTILAGIPTENIRTAIKHLNAIRNNLLTQLDLTEAAS